MCSIVISDYILCYYQLFLGISYLIKLMLP